MDSLPQLFENNRRWAEKMERNAPGFFASLADVQRPEYLWIGCSDSRVPANEIVGLKSGELFVHRNVANVVVHSDLNCLTVIQYAVEVLQVKHIIVCGHYHCGGVQAALRNTPLGMAQNWIRHIQDVYQMHRDEIESFQTEEQKVARLCERNVMEQLNNVARTTVVQQAWERGQQVDVHGWIYDVRDGLLKELQDSISAQTAPPMVG
jgi:carbonic anhydrase